MHRATLRRPSSAMLVSIVALVIASTGTAIAAGLVNGDNLIKKNSLSGNRLRNHSVTGKQLKLSALGTVPSAANARTATSAMNAAHATSADTATSATSATNAATVNGQQVQSLYAGVLGGSAAQQFMSVGGVSVTVSCASGTLLPSMSISNISSPHQAARINIEAVGTGPAPFETQGDFTSTTLLGAGSTAGTGEANAVFADHHVVTLWYSYEGGGGGVGGTFGDCLFSGHVIGG